MTISVQQFLFPIGAVAAAVTIPGAIELMLVTSGAIFGRSRREIPGGGVWRRLFPRTTRRR